MYYLGKVWHYKSSHMLLISGKALHVVITLGRNSAVFPTKLPFSCDYIYTLYGVQSTENKAC